MCTYASEVEILPGYSPLPSKFAISHFLPWANFIDRVQGFDDEAIGLLFRFKGWSFNTVDGSFSRLVYGHRYAPQQRVYMEITFQRSHIQGRILLQMESQRLNGSGDGKVQRLYPPKSDVRPRSCVPGSLRTAASLYVG